MYPPPKPSKPSPSWIRYSGMGFQMAATMALCGWGGSYLDGIQHTSKPVYTLAGLLIGVGVSLYQVIRTLK